MELFTDIVDRGVRYLLYLPVRQSGFILNVRVKPICGGGEGFLELKPLPIEYLLQ